MSPLEPPQEPSIEPPPTQVLKQVFQDPSPLCFPNSLGKEDQDGVRKILHGIPVIDAQFLLDELIGAMEVRGTIRTSPVRWFGGLVRKYKLGQFSPSAAKRSREGRTSGQETSVKEKIVLADAEVAKANLSEIAAMFRMQVSP